MSIKSHWTYTARVFRNFYDEPFEEGIPAIRINGWAVIDAGPKENQVGINLGFWFNNSNLVEVNFTEQDLLEMLTEIQILKRNHNIVISPQREIANGPDS